MSGVMDWEGKAGESWAAEWRRTDRSFGGLTDRLLARTRDFSFDNALDIGCGAGELSLAIGRGRHRARIVGVDISRDLVETARRRGERLTNVSFEIGDAARWRSADGFRPELLVSRHGVMFFDDPVAAFAHLGDIAAPGASLLFSCFRGPAENEIFTGVSSLLPSPASPPDPEAPGPMAFADPDRVRAILSAAGWAAIEFELFDFAMVAGAGEDPVADAMDYFLTIGPAARQVAQMEPEERSDFLVRLRAYLATKNMDGLVAFGAGAWIVSARRS